MQNRSLACGSSPLRRAQDTGPSLPRAPPPLRLLVRRLCSSVVGNTGSSGASGWKSSSRGHGCSNRNRGRGPTCLGCRRCGGAVRGRAGARGAAAQLLPQRRLRRRRRGPPRPLRRRRGDNERGRGRDSGGCGRGRGGPASASRRRGDNGGSGDSRRSGHNRDGWGSGRRNLRWRCARLHRGDRGGGCGRLRCRGGGARGEGAGARRRLWPQGQS